MEATAALGVASSVVQLLTFAGTLLDKGREIYRAADGVTIQNRELETITSTLVELDMHFGRAVRTHLQEPRHRRSLDGKPMPKSKEIKKFNGERAPSADAEADRLEQDIRMLCSGCKELSVKLQQALQKLSVQGERTRWKSFRAALACIWSESAISEMANRVEQYRRQVDTLLLMSLRGKVDDIEARILTWPAPSTESSNGTSSSFFTGGAFWGSEIMKSVSRNNWQPEKDHDLERFSTAVSEAMTHEREIFLKNRLVALLDYSGISERYFAIAEAHQKTFEWIFRDPAEFHDWLLQERGMTDAYQSAISANPPRWDNFVRWMQGSESLYWITGKPGSGKSTLMKFLHDEPRMRLNMKSWADGKEIIHAGFYFWNSGEQMQMSREGLLRALLSQILQSRPMMIPVAFKRRWNAHQLFGGDPQPWTWLELTEALEFIVTDRSHRFVFLIDGLDEFEGDSTELAEFVLRLAKSDNVKLCVSSRPWLAFEEAFQGRPRLQMEDLTAKDIHLFVTESLRRSPMFRTMEQYMPESATALILETTEKAEGVFLWVRIVVQSLLEGCRDGDAVEDLRARLQTLPSDLDELFHKILDRLNPQYFKDTSEMFQLVEASPVFLMLSDLSFAQEGMEKALARDVEPLTPAETAYRAESTRRRVMSRTKGLLDTPRFDDCALGTKVMYLHRTVKDFLHQRKNWEYIMSGADSFNAPWALAAASLLRIKTANKGDKAPVHFWSTFLQCVQHLKLVKRVDEQELATVFGELHASSEQYWGKDSNWANPVNSNSWTGEWSPESHRHNEIWFKVTTPFEHAFRVGFTPYLAQQIDGDFERAGPPNLTDTSLAPVIERCKLKIQSEFRNQQMKYPTNEPAIRSAISVVLVSEGIVVPGPVRAEVSPKSSKPKDGPRVEHVSPEKGSVEVEATAEAPAEAPAEEQAEEVLPEGKADSVQLRLQEGQVAVKRRSKRSMFSRISGLIYSRRV